MVINGRFLTQRVTGVQRFAREVLAQLQANNSDSNAFDVLIPQSAAVVEPPAGQAARAIGSWQGHFWEQFDLSVAERDKVLVNFCNTAPAFRKRQLVVLHDAMVAEMPQNFTPAFRHWYRAMIGSYTRRAQRIATVSAFSAGEISRHFGVPLRAISVIPESGEHILRVAADDSVLARLGLEQDAYFLAVSSVAPNKNFQAVVAAAALLQRTDFKFVVVGGSNARVFSGGDIDATNVVRTGYVSDAELRALYERAACFIYPSLYEGFGLPPLEAMTCGCPVVVSNASSMPEVCGDAAEYCIPDDHADVARALGRVLDSSALRAQLRAAGLARASEWRWRDAAASVAGLVQELQ